MSQLEKIFIPVKKKKIKIIKPHTLPSKKKTPKLKKPH